MTEIERDIRLLIGASDTINSYIKRFKGKHCRRGTKIGTTGARFGNQNATVNGRKARPDQVVVMYGNNCELTGLYPLVAAIKESKK